MLPTHSLLGRWIQENNEHVGKWKQQDRVGVASQDHRRNCSSEFNKLLKTIQGIPPLADHAQLELTVAYNACVASLAHSQFSEAELRLKHAMQRVLQNTTEEPVDSDPLVFWRTALQLVENTSLKSSVRHLLGLQWAVWLASCQMRTIQEFQDELFSLCETMCAGDWDEQGREAKNKLTDIPQLVLEPRRLLELLHICTLITQGAEKLSEGQSAEALSGLQTASSLPAPRSLVAYTHLLSGACLVSMDCPQMALHCYKLALETDPLCVCALYRAVLVYGQVGNTQAEIQALSLLHSTLTLPSVTEPPHLLSPASLLRSQSLSSLLTVPSAQSVLHTVAQKCALSGRVSEGVEYYLDLLASLHTEVPNGVHTEFPSLPRMPELYLEAGAALLMAHRPADCMALCEEVITSTLELLPEKAMLEEAEERCEVETGAVGAAGGEKVKMLLWTGAAYLLQGHSHSHLKDWKQAVTHYTRCISLLVKVRFRQERGSHPQIPSADMADKPGTDVFFLQRMKALSLAGRGICFSQMDQGKEALRNLQLSLQALPDCCSAGLWCGEVLWRLGRRQEAAACWKKTWSFSSNSSEKGLYLYLQEPQTGPLLDSMELRDRIKALSPTL